MQTNTIMYVFNLQDRWFVDYKMYTGPQKSMPVLANALYGFTVALGSWSISGE